MKFQDDISNMNTHTHTYIHTDKPKPICPPLFQSWGHNKGISQNITYLAYSDAPTNLFFPRTIPVWNRSLSHSFRPKVQRYAL